ncbi:MAG: hypothetical protein ACRC62_08925 [Microcoleus sp.]
MNQKQRQRIGSAIGTIILSCAALSLATADKLQAAVLTYNFTVAERGGSGFFKFNNSSLTGIGREEIAVSEGRLDTYLTASAPSRGLQGKDYYDLTGATASFYQGEFRGLQAIGYDFSTKEINIPAGEPGGPFYAKYTATAGWQMGTDGLERPDNKWRSLFWGYSYFITLSTISTSSIEYVPISYVLVDTVAEPIPEPITFAGTALALAGLSWLKYKKKTTF